jgi:peptide/nickel transport system substrate-binding protein
LAHAIDRQGLVDAVHEGQGIILDALVARQAPAYAAADRAVTKYPYDLRRADQLMNEAGFAKGSDGFYALTSSVRPADQDTGPTEGRFSMEVRASTGTQNEQETAILVEGWQRAGVDATSYLFPVVRLQEREFRATFPGVYFYMGTLNEGFFRGLSTGAVPRSENRWVGNNQGGWSDPEFDALLDRFESTLDQAERNNHVVQMAKRISEQVAVFPLYYDFSVRAHAASIVGPRPSGASWNVHEWQLN